MIQMLSRKTNLLTQISLQVSQKRRKDGGTLGPNINSVAGIEP